MVEVTGKFSLWESPANAEICGGIPPGKKLPCWEFRSWSTKVRIGHIVKIGPRTYQNLRKIAETTMMKE